MPDEEYIVRFTIETADSLNKAVAFESAVASVKARMAEAARETGKSFDVLAQGFKTSIKTTKDVFEQFPDMKKVFPGADIKSAAQAQAFLISAVSKASAELNQEAAASEKVAIAMGKLSDQTRQQAILDQQVASRKKATGTDVREKIAANQQYINLTKEAAKAEESAAKEASQASKIAAKEKIADNQQYVNLVKADAQDVAKTEQAAIKASSQAAKIAAQEKIAVNKQYVELYKAEEKTKAELAKAEAKKVAQEQKEALKSTRTEAQQSTSIWQKLGQSVSVAFGLGIYQLIMKVVSALQQATVAGYNFAKATYQLSIGINALRRAGVDITLKDMYENLDKLQKKFGIFSKVELIEGAAAFANLVRDMGFTKDQIFELQGAVSTLAIVNGRAMDDVQRTVALALSSGYTEGLQRLGVSINRVNIALKAEELGYGRVYMTLTEAQRAEATEILILEKTAKYANDVATYQDTLAGSIDKTTGQIKDQNAALGEELLPAMRFWKEAQLLLLGGLTFLIDKLAPVIDLTTGFYHAIKSATDYMKDHANAVDIARFAYEKFHNMAIIVLNDIYRLSHAGKNEPGLVAAIGEEGIAKLYGRQTPEEAALAEQEKATQDSADRIFDFMEKMAKEQLDLKLEKDADMLEAENDFWDDMAKIDEENVAKIADIRAKYDEKVSKIGAELSRDIADARRKAERDTADANRDFNNKVASANAKYRENQLKAEIDYQERLKKLREGFLMDLEEALHERDARQILRLIRQYNLQKQQAKRENDINIEEMKRAHAMELEELAKQRAERLRAIQQELQDKITSIQAEAAIRLEEARKAKDAELAEQKAKYDQEKIDRAAAWEAEKVDIDNKYRARLIEIAKNLALEYKLTQDELAKIAKLYDGLNNYAATAARAAGTYIKQLYAAVAVAQSLAAPLYGKIDESKNWNFKVNKRASGGVDYVTEPTLFMAGEAGNEMVITKPLTKAFSGQEYFNGNPISGLSDKKGSMDISLLLSPDLVAKVVRQSGDYVANVMLEVQRQK